MRVKGRKGGRKGERTTPQMLAFFLFAVGVVYGLNGTVTSTSEGNVTFIINNRTIPLKSSSWSVLNSYVLSPYFSTIPPNNISSPLVNSSKLSYLTLEGGTWAADEPLILNISTLILVLVNCDIQPTSSFPPFRAMIEVNKTEYAGVVAPAGPYSPDSARFACPDASVSPGAVWGVDSGKLYVDGISVYGCGRTHGGSVHIQGTPGVWGWTVSGATVTNCALWNSTRAVWTESVSGVVVHNNSIFNCSSHALDFDAFTHYSTATSNNIWGNSGREGVFIECVLYTSGTQTT